MRLCRVSIIFKFLMSMLNSTQSKWGRNLQNSTLKANKWQTTHNTQTYFDCNINEEADIHDKISLLFRIHSVNCDLVSRTILMLIAKKKKKNDMEMKESVKHHQWKIKIKMEKPANTCTFRAIQIAMAE